jgi:hypothetical protein
MNILSIVSIQPKPKNGLEENVQSSVLGNQLRRMTEKGKYNNVKERDKDKKEFYNKIPSPQYFFLFFEFLLFLSAI